MTSSRSNPGFTLLELIVVLVIAGTLASLVTLSLRSHFDRSRSMRAFRQVCEADRQARLLATSLPDGRVKLVMQGSKQTVELAPSGRTFSIPSSVQIVDTIVYERGRRRNDVRIPFFSNGTSASYSVHIEAGKSETWIAVLGMSGQCVRCETAAELGELF